MRHSMAYAKELYSDNIDGYIQIMHKEGEKVVKIYNTQYAGIREILEEVEGKEDVYITPNTFFRPKRKNEFIRQFRALYIDIDLKRGLNINNVIQEIILKVVDNKIPMPSMFVDSGRGLHLYWIVKDAPYQAIYTWQELEDYLYYQLKDLGADKQATDAARLLRLPNTINSRNKKECKILHSTDEKYSMYELRQKYLGWKPKKPAHDIEIIKRNSKVVNLFNSYTLHLARLRDIIKLCELRKWHIAPRGLQAGKRNAFVHLYAYWEGLYTRNIEELTEKVNKFNAKFDIPLSDKEVSQIIRSVNKAIDKFIEWSHSKTPLQQGEKDKPGYWYTNARLIDLLEITPEEQKHLETIISREERNRRDKEKKKQSRRNEDGLTKREQQKQAKIKAIKELKEQGLTNVQIAEKLGISRVYVSRILNQKV